MCEQGSRVGYLPSGMYSSSARLMLRGELKYRSSAAGKNMMANSATVVKNEVMRFPFMVNQYSSDHVSNRFIRRK